MSKNILNRDATCQHNFREEKDKVRLLSKMDLGNQSETLTLQLDIANSSGDYNQSRLSSINLVVSISDVVS